MSNVTPEELRKYLINETTFARSAGRDKDAEWLREAAATIERLQKRAVPDGWRPSHIVKSNRRGTFVRWLYRQTWEWGRYMSNGGSTSGHAWTWQEAIAAVEAAANGEPE